MNSATTPVVRKCPTTTDLRRFRSGQHFALRRWKKLINGSEYTRCRLCDNKAESYDHFWLRCPAFDANHQKLDLGTSYGELIRFQQKLNRC